MRYAALGAEPIGEGFGALRRTSESQDLFGALQLFLVSFYRWWGRMAHAVFAWVFFVYGSRRSWVDIRVPLLRCCWTSVFLPWFFFFPFEGVVGRVFEVFFYLFECSHCEVIHGG